MGDQSAGPSLRLRAVALSAMLMGDYDLEALDAAIPELATAVRDVAAPLLQGPREELGKRINAERALLVSMPTLGQPVRLPSGKIVKFAAQFGLWKVLRAHLGEAPSAVPIPKWLNWLTDGVVAKKLASLTMGLMRRAAKGEVWAVRLVASSAAQIGNCAEVAPRLAPGLVWVGKAFAHDAAVIEVLSENWPEPLTRLVRTFPEAENGVGMSAEDADFLRAKLEEEIRSRG